MIKKIILSLIAILIWTAPAFAAEYFVDSSAGDDSFPGTANAPYKTIQKAVENLSAGDIVTVLPGVYFGPVNITVRGTAENPIIIRSMDNRKNKTIITCANKEIREKTNTWEIYDEENNIWVTDYNVSPITDNGAFSYTESDFCPANVMCDDVELMNYQTVEQMKRRIYNLKTESGTYMPGMSRGYCYDHENGKLYVMLDKSGKYKFSTPNNHTIKVSPSKYSYLTYRSKGFQSSYGDCIGADSYCIRVGELSANKWIYEEKVAESYNVTIDGFTFETPSVCGVFCHSSNVTVKNCFFVGCRSGVRGATRCNREDMIYSVDILIENCDYSRSEVYNEAVEIIEEYNENPKEMDFVEIDGITYKIDEYFWWARKAERQHFNYEVGGIATRMGENWTIKDCYIHDCFDGISYAGMDKYGYYDTVSKAKGSLNIEFIGNKFERCLDNCIEVENHGRNISVHDNLFYNNFVIFSWQPLGKLPLPTNILFYDNVVHNTRDFNEFWTENTGYILRAFKIGASAENWQDIENPSVYHIPDKIVLEERGISIFNNTIVMPGARLFTNVGTGSKSMNRTNYIPFKNFQMVNNVIVCDTNPTGKNGMNFNSVKVQDVELKGIDFSNNIFSADYGACIDLSNERLDDSGSVIVHPKKIGFKKISRLNLNPEIEEDSFLRNRGVLVYKNIDSSLLGCDVGALQYGEIFEIMAGVKKGEDEL